MSTSAGNIITNASTYTKVFDPSSAEDGYATTVAIWSATVSHYVYVSNLNPDNLRAADSALYIGSDSVDEPLYLTVFPRGTGAIYAKTVGGAGVVSLAIVSRWLL